MNYVRFSVMAMLFWSAVVNGVLAPPLVVLAVLLASDRGVMGRHFVSPLLRTLGWMTAAVMTLATIGMFSLAGKS